MRAKLDRKYEVDHIRTRVGEVIRQSQAEVEYKMTTGREKAAERSAHKSFERQNEYQYRASNFHRKSFDNRE